MIFRFQQQAKDDQDMKVVGMPERFWVVTRPTPNSEIGDCCFECTFGAFALQVRGGLEVEQIVGIYANEQDAKSIATNLLAGRDAVVPTDLVIHASPWPGWFATQEDRRSVWICDRASNEKMQFMPPLTWGEAWAWNISEDGTGIYMRRTA